MIDTIQQQLSAVTGREHKLNKLREILQIICLKILYDKKAFEQLVFVGGTALRILYDLKRFSEDLDFSLVNKENFDFFKMTEALNKEFALYGFKTEMKARQSNTVYAAMIKFNDLLKPLGLSALRDQKLSIKIEIDSNPPAGGIITNTVVNKMYMFNIVHFDLPSMFATKLHACFCRKFTKGRDFYDFIWYLTKEIQPNFTLLNNAVLQTQGKNPQVNEANFNDYLIQNIKRIDFETARRDVERFLEDKAELQLLDRQIIEGMILKG